MVNTCFRNVYIYDGSFDGLLTAVYDVLASGAMAESIVSEEESGQLGLADIRFNVATDMTKSSYIAGRIKHMMSDEAMQCIYYTFRSSYADRGICICRAVKVGLAGGSRTKFNFSSPEYAALNVIYNKVGREIHLLKGFTRFVHKKGDVYYAAVSPEHDIIEFLAEYFGDRMRDCSWVLHDYVHGKAAIGKKGRWTIIFSDSVNVPDNDADEEIWQNCWKTFYTTIEIKERHNPKLRRQLMPYKYWRNILEMQKK